MLAPFVGGSGVNTLTLSDASLVAPGSSLNGGSGAPNVIQVDGFANTAADYAALNQATGFTILGLVDALNNNAKGSGINGDTVDASQPTTFSAGDTITNIASGSTVTVLHTGLRTRLRLPWRLARA